MKLQIKDWDLHFENDRSRQRAKCSFVCVPNKQHGMGFCRIMAEPDGAAIYGIWHLILGACSQQTKRNGWLTSDGEQTGTPWGVEDLQLKFRRPEKEIKRAIQVLTSERVGWIANHEVTADSPPCDIEGRKEGIEGKNGNGGFVPTPSMIRVGKIFKRRETTRWTPQEVKAIAAIEPINEDDFKAIERYYGLSLPQDSDYRRRDLVTLLNNWNGEVDRARKYRHNPHNVI
jgi:hypothetical protein